MIKKLFFISILSLSNILLASKFCEAQTGIINTIAGTGAIGYTGNGGPATSATINNPIQVVTDDAGNIYFADKANNVIRKINTSGIITTVAGTGVAGYTGDGGLATAAELNGPWGVAVDATGNIYIGDTFNERIRKVSISGIITTIAGNGTTGYFGDGGLATTAELNIPALMRIDNGGNLFFCDNGNQRIRKINTSGVITTVAGNGIAGYSGDGGPATSAKINYPSGVMVDATGNIYISDAIDDVIRMVNTTGTINTIAGIGSAGFSGDGGSAVSAALNYPQDIFVDDSGNIYFVDTDNERVRKINTAGIINTIAGDGIVGYSGDGGLATTAELNQPDGIFVDNSGGVYISDPSNQRIRKVEISPNNHPPHFTEGPAQNLSVCENSIGDSINSLLAIIDTDTGQTETWTLTIPPVHGSVFVTYTATSTGGIITPVGLYYTPNAGYTGSDVFDVTVSDGIASNETQITVAAEPLPTAGIISGIDSVCPGQTDTLSENVSGGVWSYSNVGVTTISFSGVVTGMSPGYDTIIYTIVNSCGIVSAIFPFEVLSDCVSGVTVLSNIGTTGIQVFPNPTPDGELTVSLITNTEDNVQYTITNVTGQELKEFTNHTNNPMEIKFDAPPGVYFLTAITKGNKWNKKIIVNPH